MSPPSAQRVRDLLARVSPAAARRFVHIEAVATTPSTNTAVLSAGAGAPLDGAVVMAREQTGGRGRLGRRWSSPSGNLYLSLQRRMVEPLERAGIVSLLTGIALCEAVRSVTGLTPALKWPNDLLVGERKLAGILLEAHGPWQVVGLGLNVNTRVADLDPAVSEIATTLLELTGRTWDLEALAAAFLAAFDELETAFCEAPVLPVARYLRYFPFVGTTVAVQTTGRTLTAPIRGVAEDGALLLAGPDGEEVRVTTGEVQHVRAR